MIGIDKIYNEDCLQGMKRIADGAVDCIITDLPYGNVPREQPLTPVDGLAKWMDEKMED